MINIQVIPAIKLNPIDQRINFVYYVYSCVYEQMLLNQVEPEVFVFIPRLIWDSSCDHYHLCEHELLWQQYCICILQHVIKSESRFRKPSGDILDSLVWHCMHTNAVDVITSMYCGLDPEELRVSFQRGHDDMYDVFIKYLKLNQHE